MERQVLKILYGLTLKTSEHLRERIEQKLTDKGVELSTVCRYRKDGIYQYVKTQNDMILILEENLQGSSPYEHQEMVHLTDLGFHKIIFLLDCQHYGSEYIKMLYVCGILNAVFLEEATSETIVRLIATQGRTNEEARDYYGIQTLRDAEKKRDIINTENLNAYLEYIEESTLTGEINERYRFVASRLGIEENKALISSVSSRILRLLQENEVYQFYRKNNQVKRKIFQKAMIAKPEGFFRKKELGSDNVPDLNSDAEAPEPIRVQNELANSICFVEPIQETEDGEVMLTTLERFRSCQAEEKKTISAEDQKEQNLLMNFGQFLRQIDR